MTLLKGHFSLLSWKDSNPRKRNQNPMCYHYTTGQFLIATAKVVLFLLLARKKSTFFHFFYFARFSMNGLKGCLMLKHSGLLANRASGPCFALEAS